MFMRLEEGKNLVNTTETTSDSKAFLSIVLQACTAHEIIYRLTESADTILFGGRVMPEIK